MLHKNFILLSVLLFASILVGGGCKTNSQDEVVVPSTPSVAVKSSQEYIWQAQGISFKYPADMFILDLGDRLYINADSSALPEGYADLYYTQLDITENATVEQVVQLYKDDESILKSFSEEKIGDYTFVKIEYEDWVTSEIYRHYILQVRNNVLDYRVGNNNHKGDKNLTLSSLKF